MKQRIISIALSALTLYSGAMAKNTIENIDRGVVALPQAKEDFFSAGDCSQTTPTA